MAVAKKDSFPEKLIFLFFVLFPFGQLLRTSFLVDGLTIRFHLLDIVAGLSLIYWLRHRLRKLSFNPRSPFFGLVIVLLFSTLYSLTLFPLKMILFGSLYLWRLSAYFSLFPLAVEVVKRKRIKKKLLFRSLIAVSGFIGLFGLIQYFVFPDFRPLAVWEWDDHLYRLVSTFLDPGFTSIILVFGFLASLVIYLKERNRKTVGLLIFFLLGVALTYSRAGFLALMAGSGVALIRSKQKRLFVWLAAVLLAVILFLPRPAGEGVKLERVASIYQRLENYQTTLIIWKSSPIFGIGFNNLCFARQSFLGESSFQSHSCSGSDSSLLQILATTGIVGLLVVINLFKAILSKLSRERYGNVFLACFSALIVHSLFVNSLLYPWVIGWLLILLSLALRGSKEKSKG